MTIKDCIDMVDNLKPNQYTILDKVQWLSFIEGVIINDVLKTHEGYDGKYDDFSGYSEDKLSVPLIVQSPYDRLYTAYLKMKIDEENGETARYNNSAAMFNSYMDEFKKYYNKTHMPLNITDKATTKPTNKPSVGLSEAEFENLKKDMTYILTEYFAEMVSEVRIAEVIRQFALNNMQMLKGKDGYTPIRGTDYFNESDKEAIRTYVASLYGKEISTIDNSIRDITSALNELKAKVVEKVVTITLKASKWVWMANGDRCSQVVSIPEATAYSKIDLQLSEEQLAIFHEKDITFVAENVGGTITVYCIGQMPANDYTIQATITEVSI